MAKLNRVKLLADAVARSFEVAGFSPADLLGGPIAITELPWQAPPLKVERLYWGMSFSSYLDYPLAVKSEELFEWYRNGLYWLKHSPEMMGDSEGYFQLTKLFVNTRAGERKLALPLPDGWPTGEYSTGSIFALEVARLFKTSSKDLLGFSEDDSNYYAETPWGKVGIVDGYVSEHRELWDVSCAGLVEGLLESPRGCLTTSCLYDTIARLRSVLHEEAGRFTDFEMVDYALQALRVLADGEICRELHQALTGMSAAGFKRKARIKAFEEALATMLSWSMTDRVKISTLQELLVPTHMNLAEYSRKILDPYKIMPSVLSTRVEARIVATLRHELLKATNADQAFKPH
jgi:hypothetical protein